jgi:hypothetical protein
MNPVRKRLTYANVVATIALFAALTGGVYAAATITGKDIKKNSVPGKDLKKRSVTAKQIKKETLTGAQLKDNAVTGSDIDETTLEVTRIATRPKFDGSQSVAPLNPGDPPVAIPLTDNSWTAKPGEIDSMGGYVEFTPNPACGVGGAIVFVTFKIGNAPIGSVVPFPGATSTRMPIATTTFIPFPGAGGGAPDIPDADQPRTLSADILAAQCSGAPAQPAGTITAIRSGVIANR